LVAGVIAGIIQIILGLLKAGIIGYYFPSAVIKGMLAGIGITLILKQIPHALGYDKNPEGDWAFYQTDGHNTFSEIWYALQNPTVGAIIITAIALGILLLFQSKAIKKNKLLNLIPGPLIAVIAAIALNELFKSVFPELTLVNESSLLKEQVVQNNHLVNIKAADTSLPFWGLLTFPDWTILSNPRIYMIGFTMAVVASLETLLCVEATDKLDPQKRTTPTNRELLAQGTGNVVSSLLGGLPITQVIVRSSANINSGGKTKMSAILHGVFLAVFVLLLPWLLNLIPLACLAAILLLVGYKLSSVKLFKQMYDNGISQFLPFVITIGFIIFTNLLWGIIIGLAVSIFFIIRRSYENALYSEFKEEEEEDNRRRTIIQFGEVVSFFNKGHLHHKLNEIPDGSHLIIDGSKNEHMDYDIYDIFQDFIHNAKSRNIELEFVGFDELTKQKLKGNTNGDV